MDPHGHAAAWLALRTPQPIPSVLPCSENPPLLRKPLSTTPHTWRTSPSIPQPPASSWLTGHPNPSPYVSTPTNPCTTLIPSWLSAHPNPPPCPLRGLRGHPSPSPFPPRFEGHSNHTLKISSKLPRCPNPSLHTLPLLGINPNPTPYPPSPLLAWRTPRPSLSPTPAPYPGTLCRSLWTGRSRQRPHPAAGGSPAAPQTCGKGGLRAGMAGSVCRGVPQHWLPPGDVAGGRRGGADLRQVSDVHEGLVEAVELEGAGQEEKTCREDVGEEPGYGELLQAQVTQPAWREEGQHGLSSIPPQPRLNPPAPGRALVPPQGPHGGQGTLTGYH